MTTISSEKLHQFTNTADEWDQFSKRTFGEMMVKDKHYILMMAQGNEATIRTRAETLAPKLDSGDLNTAQVLKDQAYVYGWLVRAVATHGPEYINRADPFSDTCGTDLWNVLLEQFQNSSALVKSRTLINLSNYCLSFKGGRWSTYYGGAEKLANQYKASNGSQITVDDLMMALQLQGMILAGGQWQTLATMCMTNQTLTLETLRARAFNHSIQYGLESGARELEAHNADTKSNNQTDKPRDELRDDIKSLLEAMAADRQRGGGGGKYCPYHKTTTIVY